DDAKSGIIISSSAIQGSSDHPKVYVVRDGKAILQEVTIVANKANSVIISSGLSDGDILITGGFINLFDGANVSSN
ncbi:MAG: efflux RND transporter periplasmic adaptor subunit, partial [Crocinitomicaceae bacterium]|nr:efflux RND transporter periplasmic adaptor subunit [Crocinitomicaceae bacterium]